MSGRILDATLMTVPKQCNTNAEKADIRAGRIPQDWQGKSAKLSTRSVMHAGYRAKANEVFMEKHGFVSTVHRKKPYFKSMLQCIQRSNARKSASRSRVEHVFADQQSQMGLFVQRVGITRVIVRIWLPGRFID
jgi:hypothetical protein